MNNYVCHYSPTIHTEVYSSDTSYLHHTTGGVAYVHKAAAVAEMWNDHRSSVILKLDEEKWEGNLINDAVCG